MRKYGESKTTRIMMATVPHVTSGLGLRKFQADGLFLTRVYMYLFVNFQFHIHSNGLETLHQHVPRKILPNEYGGEAGKLDELYGRYSRAHCIVTDNTSPTLPCSRSSSNPSQLNCYL